MILASIALLMADFVWLPVGHPGNKPDHTGFGSVPYAFQIAKHEVTNEQYVEFLNAVARTSDRHQLWSPSMAEPLLADGGQGGIQENLPVFLKRTGQPGDYRYECLPGWEKKPVVYVSFLRAMRFANWLHNGKGSGDTESGAYDMKRGGLAPRSPQARYWIPSENEWYKAAYYEPNEQGGRYWTFATRSDDLPKIGEPGAQETNAASYGQTHEYRRLREVGSLPRATSYFGTLDQNGNAWEWNEAILFESRRGLRGGSVAHVGGMMRSSVRMNASPEKEYPDTGFRLARARTNAR